VQKRVRPFRSNLLVPIHLIIHVILVQKVVIFVI
jgi:hypothetical protein